MNIRLPSRANFVIQFMLFCLFISGLVIEPRQDFVKLYYALARKSLVGNTVYKDAPQVPFLTGGVPRSDSGHIYIMEMAKT